MMEAVGLVDPALVEQAAGPARRHSARRPLRTGLIAACLCAALLGSAWAANQIGGFRSLKFFEDLLLPAELSDDGETSWRWRICPRRRWTWRRSTPPPRWGWT